jgi:hypothetical protein
MTNPSLEAVLAGSDEDEHLWALYLSITSPKNEVQRTFHRAYEALVLLASDGFEKLFEQDTSLEEYAEAVAQVGMPQLKSIFDQVLALVPDEVRRPENEEALFDHLHRLFDEFKRLAYDSYDSSADSPAIVARYVRRHRDQFVQ